MTNESGPQREPGANLQIDRISDKPSCPKCQMSYSPRLPLGPCARCDMESFMIALKEYKKNNPDPVPSPSRDPSLSKEVVASVTPRAKGKKIIKNFPAPKDAAQTDIRTVGLDTEAKMSAFLADSPVGEDFIYFRSLGWMKWTGVRWAPAAEVEVIEAIRVYVTTMYSKAYVDRNPTTEKLARQYMSRTKIANLESLMRGQLLKDPAILDAHPDLLNTPTGVVDLKTGTLSPHRKDLYLTRITSVGYQAGFTHPDWDQAVQALPAGICDWFQVNLGQSLTGYTCTEDRMFFNQGGGANGKTTIMSVAGKASGDYFVLVHDKVIIGDPGPEALALRGARFALIEELPEQRHLNLAALKKLIGTEVIAARPLYKDTLEFRPTHTLWVSTNFRPMVAESDHGSWRRITLVTFPYRYVRPGKALEGPMDRVGDPMLRARLLTSTEGQEAALAWMVAGAVKWFQAGKQSPEDPPEVVEGTREWRKESDQVMAFFEDHLEHCLECHVMGQELHQEFNAWLKSRSQSPWSAQLFYERLLGHPELGASRLARRKMKRSDTLSRRCAGTSWLADQGSQTAPDQYNGVAGVKFRC